MIKLLNTGLAILLVSLAMSMNIVSAEAPKDIGVEIIRVPNEMDLVDIYADKWGVSREKMKATISCESGWNTKIQSYATYKEGNRWGFTAGEREKSYGLAQIHLPAHKDVTYEQATDPNFAIEFMAKKFSEGKQSMWVCYTKLYGA